MDEMQMGWHDDAVGKIANHGSRVPDLILCGVSCQTSSWFVQVNNVGCISVDSRYKCGCMVPCNGLTSHSGSISASCKKLTNYANTHMDRCVIYSTYG